MIIDFAKEEFEVVQNFLGGDGEVHKKLINTDNGRIMYLRIPKGGSIGMHTHTENSETMYIVKGIATAIDDSGVTELTPGMSYYCPKGCAHSTRNDHDEPMEMFAVVESH